MHRLRKEHRAFDIKSESDAVSISTESLLFDDKVRAVMKLARAIRKEDEVPHGDGHVHLRGPDPDQRRRQETRRSEAGRQAQEGLFEALRAELQETRQILAERQRQEEDLLRREQEDLNTQRQDPMRDEGPKGGWGERTANLQHRYGRLSRPAPNFGPPRTPTAPDTNQSPIQEPSNAQDEDNSSRVTQNEIASLQIQRYASPRSPLGNSPSESTAGSLRPKWNEGREDSDFMRVSASPNTLELKASRSPQRVQGFIEDGHGEPRDVVAILEPEQTFNFMTDNLASELSLLHCIEPCTGQEEVETWIESAGGLRIKPLGKVRVRWGTFQEHSDFSLEFWIAPYHRERALVLGGPFISKSDYYNRRRGS